MDVGEEDLGSIFHEQGHQSLSYIPCTLDGHFAAAQLVRSVGGLRGSFQTTVNTIGGHRAGVSAPSHLLGQTCHVLGGLLDVHHFRGAHAHILGGDVATVQAVHELPESAEHGFRLLGARITDDHGLTTTKVQASQGALVGHTPAQAQYIVQGFRLRSVRPHARSTQGWPQRRVVDGDDGFEARRTIIAEEDLFVIVVLHAAQHQVGGGGFRAGVDHGLVHFNVHPSHHGPGARSMLPGYLCSAVRAGPIPESGAKVARSGPTACDRSSS